MPNAETTRPTATRGEPVTEQPPALAGAVTDAHPVPALDQPFDEEGLFTLRSAVAAHAAELGADRSLSDTILVAHELSSNAVRHGGGSGHLRVVAGRRIPLLPGLRLRAGTGRSGAGRDRPPVAVGPRRPGTVDRPASGQLHIASGPDGTRITAAIRAA